MTLAVAERALLRTGAALVAVSMATGLLVGLAPGVRLLLSAHIAGTIAGGFLVAVGAAAHKLHLTDTARGWMVRLLGASGILNWVATVLGAALGTHELTPINGAGTAGPAAEAVVGAMLVVMVGCTFGGLGLLFHGTRAPGAHTSAG